MENALNPQIVQKLLDWYRRSARILPWRSDPTPYHVWLSEIMLQQTRVETVIPYYERFLAAVPDIHALAQISLDSLYKLWEGLGYYSRARHLHEAALEIESRFGGNIPGTTEELLSLPGIGSYTAGAISSIAFQQHAAAVDGNVLRVLARLNDDARNVLSPAVKRDCENQVMQLMPFADCPGDLSQALIELGALICKPQEPLCAQCPLSGHCSAFRAGHAESLPVREKPKQKRVTQKTVFLIRDGSSYAILKNKKPGLLGGLYALPTAEGMLTAQEALDHVQALGCECLRIRELGTGRHIFTHRIWEMTGYELFIAPGSSLDVIWASKKDIDERYAMPSAFSYYLSFIS